MKYLTLYHYRSAFKKYEQDRLLKSDETRLFNRLEDAGRSIAKSLLKQIKDFTNAIHESALHDHEIDRRIHEYKEGVFQKNYYFKNII